MEAGVRQGRAGREVDQVGLGLDPCSARRRRSPETPQRSNPWVRVQSPGRVTDRSHLTSQGSYPGLWFS